MTISASDARALYTKELIAVYQERIRATNFLTNFFKFDYSGALEISIEVERMGELVAVDVVRGTEGNFNDFNKSTEKIFIPPYFAELFDATQLSIYDKMIGALNNNNTALFASLLNRVSDRLGSLEDKIKRKIELMAAAVLENGQVVTEKHQTFDFKRRTGTLASGTSSIVDAGGGNYFADNADPFALLEQGCNFIRTYGKSVDAEFNAIIGDTSWNNLLKNTKFKERQNLFNMKLDNVSPMVRNGAGSAYHGSVECGSYRVHFWTYPQFYDTTSGTGGSTTLTRGNRYWPANKTVLLPMNPNFKLAHAQVPVLAEPGMVPANTGAWVVDQKLDEWEVSHKYRVRTAVLPVPVAVDQIWTCTTN